MEGKARYLFPILMTAIIVFVVLILVGLLVTYVHEVRAAPARTSCQNNLKQVAISVVFNVLSFS